jgi:predicted enzyme related to lactoylglutathione lyase
MSTDPQASRDFYGALFGWDFEEMPTPQGPTYTMCRIDGKDVAGIGPLPPDMASQGMPPVWSSYVSVDNVDAMLGKVEAAGGVVMMPAMDVMDAGRMAGVVDPTGAVLMLWQPDQHIGARLVNQHGAFTWSELVTPDVDAAASFYEALFGWKTETADMGGMTYTMFNNDGAVIAGGMKPPMDGIPPHWGIYFAVDDCDAAVATATQNGATVMAEAMDSPAGRMAALADPIGANFSVIKPADPA